MEFVERTKGGRLRHAGVPKIGELTAKIGSMCGRYRLKRADQLAEKFEAIYSGDAEELRPRYNIAPTQPVLVVRASGSGRTISSVRWGLIPSWATDPSASQINARSETLLDKPSFRDSFELRRCLIPADGFYEWKRSGKTRQPFHFGMKDDSVFAFAGIWDRWIPQTGPAIESCAILTTAPNQLLNDVHDRMPAILGSEHWHEWLSISAEPNTRLLVPHYAALMKRWPVSPAVNNTQNDSPECAMEAAEFVSSQSELFG